MMKTFEAFSIIEKINCSAPKLQEMVAEASINARVAQSIYEARTLARLTQQHLANLISTKQSAIARLEDAVTQGHSFSMLQKIARALNQRV